MTEIRNLDVALVQVQADTDAGVNRERLAGALAKLAPVDFILLPEVFALRGNHADFQRAAEPVPGPLTQWLGLQAAARSAWLLAGSMTERASDGACYNTSLLFDRAGRLVTAYRKMHLFETVTAEGVHIREQDTYRAGAAPVLTAIEGWQCGLAVCYDLRFPELFRRYAAQGAHLLCVPSDFTRRTGQDHWEVLLRARAIENQCFVLAPNQCGRNARTGVESFGNSLVVDPWGTILARAGDDETVLAATLECARLEQVRARIPALRHRRADL